MCAPVPAKLQVVMGKGGVGRTTLAAALALGHARAGSRVALVTLAGAAEVEAMVRAQWGVPPASLAVVDIDPRAAVDGIVERLLHIPALAHVLTAHPAYEAVYRITPGIKEVALLHRILDLADHGPHDRVVVDAPATGHGTPFLEAPRKSARMLVGALAERAAALDAALTDPARTHVVLAATAEEMPVRETAELAGALRQARFPLQAVVANRVPPRMFPSPEALPALERLAGRAHSAALASEVGASWKSMQRLARAAVFLERQARDAEPLVRELEGLGLPLVRVPAVPAEEGRLRAVARVLEEGRL